VSKLFLAKTGIVPFSFLAEKGCGRNNMILNKFIILAETGKTRESTNSADNRRLLQAKSAVAAQLISVSFFLSVNE